MRQDRLTHRHFTFALALAMAGVAAILAFVHSIAVSASFFVIALVFGLGALFMDREP